MFDDLAASITKASSNQTFYTIRFLVDRERVDDAFRAYAYFRWVDDTLDADPVPGSDASKSTSAGLRGDQAPDRIAFLERQKSLLASCFRGEVPRDVSRQENMLVTLIQRDHEKNSGLEAYLLNMMQVMEFDARRRGRSISQSELNDYTRCLATAVTEAMHYFIGHEKYSPRDETRYLAVSAAHITHMLRDTFDDVRSGYYNIPSEVLGANHIRPRDVHGEAYRAWVKDRVQLARMYFEAGKEYLARVQDPRCRLAGFAYTARFEWLLDTIEQEAYFLRPEYRERRSFATGMRMSWDAFSSMLVSRSLTVLPSPAVSNRMGKP